MKKKIALIVFTLVCTIGIAASIVSFSLGSTTQFSQDSDNNLKDIYDSYSSQIEHIIDNSNLSGDADESYYHVVIIVDKLTKDASGEAVEDFKTYINSDKFRTSVIGKSMKKNRFKVKVYQANDADLAEAISGSEDTLGADLVYIECKNSAYKSKTLDLSSQAYEALDQYALSDFKPVIIDGEVVGASSGSSSSGVGADTNIFKLLNNYYTSSGSNNDQGVVSFYSANDSQEDMGWSDFFNKAGVSTYIVMDNSGTKSWNKYTYSSNEVQHKILTIVANESKKTNSIPGIVSDGVVNVDVFGKAFYNSKNMTSANFSYEEMTVAELNAYVTKYGTKQLPKDYDFIYFACNTEDGALYNSTSNDISSDTNKAIKYFANYTDEDYITSTGATYNVKTDGVSNSTTHIKRIIVNSDFFQIYQEATTSGKVDKSSNIYKFASKLMTISSDGKSATTYYKNVLVSSYGYFKTGEVTVTADDGTTSTAIDLDSDKISNIQHLINSSTYRSFTAGGNGRNFKVLEIEPYYEVDDSNWYQDGTARTTLTNTLENGTAQEESEANGTPFYRFNLTAARIAAATGLNINQIEVTTLTANALSSTSPSLVEDYDMIYIGDNNANVKDKEDWAITSWLNTRSVGQYTFISHNPVDINSVYFQSYNSVTLHNAYVYTTYTHTGDFVDISDQRSAFANINDSKTDLMQKSGSRTNGTDITASVYLKLYDYVKAGMPLVIDKDVLSSEYLIGGATANATLEDDKNYTITSNLTVSKDDDASKTTLTRMVMVTGTKTATSSKGSHTYKYTTYDDDTSTAREESTIDPSSYMYQFLYKIAEDETSDIYHASNVLNGFDSDDINENGLNSYLEGVTANAEETTPSNLKTITGSTKTQLVTSTTANLDEDSKITLFNSEVNRTLTGDINYAGSGSAIQLKHFLNSYATSRPVINVIKAPTDYESSRDMTLSTRITNDKSPVFKFSVLGEKGQKCTVELYYDFDGDGRYSDAKVETRVEGQYKDDECVASIDYTIGETGVVEFSEGCGFTEDDDFVIDEDFVGVMPYKLVVTVNESGKKTSVTGTPKYYGDETNKTEVRILNIVPGDPTGKFEGAGDPVTTLNANQNTVRNGGGYQYDDPDDDNDDAVFGIRDCNDSSVNLATAIEDEYNIDLTVMTTGQFCEMADAFLEDYCENFATYSSNDDLTEKEISGFKKFMDVFYDSTNKQMNSLYSKLTDWNNTTVYDFSDMSNIKVNGKYYDAGFISDKIFRKWLLDGNSTKELTIASTHYQNDANDSDSSPDGGKAQKFAVTSYDMIVVGFGKAFGSGSSGVYSYSDINNMGCQFLRAYLDNNGAAMFGSDTTSFEGFYCSNTMKWSRNINQYLRESLGMDRFKFDIGNGGNNYTHHASTTYSGNSNTKEFYSNLRGENQVVTPDWYDWVPYTTAEYDSNYGSTKTMPGEFFTVNSYNGSYEQDSNSLNGTSVMAGAGATDGVGYALAASGANKGETVFEGVTVKQVGQGVTIGETTKVSRNNTGLVTEYPFTISSQPEIATANCQSFALDTESDDLTVWYTLAGSSNDNSQLYAADPLNGRSFYYIYTYKNITYTGAGYSPVAEGKDNNDERKLLINAVLAKVKLRSNGLKINFAEYDGPNAEAIVDKLSEFSKATSTTTAVVDCKTTEPKAASFDFTVKCDNSANITEVYMFIPKAATVSSKEVEVYNQAKGDQLLAHWSASADAKKSASSDASGNAVRNMSDAIDAVTGNKSCKIKFQIYGQDYSTTLPMTEGSFYITVYAKDSEGNQLSKRILIKTTTTMFDLT